MCFSMRNFTWEIIPPNNSEYYYSYKVYHDGNLVSYGNNCFSENHTKQFVDRDIKNITKLYDSWEKIDIQINK
jgi:hypothetical protein